MDKFNETYKNMIGEEFSLKSERSIAEKDTIAANEMRNEIEDMLLNLQYITEKARDTMSQFNAPGFLFAIQKAIAAGNGDIHASSKPFNADKAIAKLKEYYSAKR